MPLDTGDMAVETRRRSRADALASLRPAAPVLDEGGGVGPALGAARRALGLGVEDIASATRVRASYIQAIEAFDFAALPSRPFVIGFVRAYARALGLDAETVVARFRAEAPPIDDDLQPPVTIDQRPSWAPRVTALAVALIVLAVVGWNLWRHAQANPPRPAAALAVAPAPAQRLQSVTLGAPPPMPAEASAPPSYQTPGLAPDPADSEPDVASEMGPIADGAPFHAHGAVYGARGQGAGLLLQAQAPTAVIVRGADGAVIFARELAAGEAWRAPAVNGLSVEVDSPAQVEVFVHNAAHGVLSDPRTALARLMD